MEGRGSHHCCSQRASPRQDSRMRAHQSLWFSPLTLLVGRVASKSCNLGAARGQGLYLAVCNFLLFLEKGFGALLFLPSLLLGPKPWPPHALLTGLRVRKCVCIPPLHRTQCPVLFPACWSWESLLTFSHFLPLNIRNIRFQK